MPVNRVLNGTIWKDTDGNPIHAHGGGFLKKDGYFYWFGENRTEGKLVSCYRSKDLVSWEFCNHVVTRNTHPELSRANAERPKVTYNEKTGRYVMWLHWENGIDYSEARCAVLVCDTVDGDYSYLRSFRPKGHMSRDCTLFKDDDGTAYFVSAARENADLHVYRLSDDYLDIASLEKVLWPGQKREAPAIVKRGDYYFLITSGCTGWEPNQGKYAYSASITGEWSDLFDIGSPTTFDTQPTYILTIQGSETTSYIYVGDRWDPSNYFNSSYVFLPLSFDTETSMSLDWASSITIDVQTGLMEAESEKSGLWRLRMGLRYLSAKGVESAGATYVYGARLSYADQDQLWVVERVSGDIIRIRHHVSGKYIEPEDSSSQEGTRIILSGKLDHARQEWRVIPAAEGHVKLQNVHTGLALKLERARERGQADLLIQAPLSSSPGGPWDVNSVLLAEVYR